MKRTRVSILAGLVLALATTGDPAGAQPVAFDDQISLFGELDKDGDGLINGPEQSALQERVFKRYPRVKPAEGLRAFDDNGDGAISKPEWLNGFQMMMIGQATGTTPFKTGVAVADKNADFLTRPPRTVAVPASAGPRVALVIGNSAYDARLGSLANPANDARSMGASLKAAGFDVEVATDLDQKAMTRAIARLGQRLNAAGKGATGLFFYAGHGLQSRGINYLAPVGAAIDTEADIDLEAVAADTVLRQMEEAGASTSIVILDACRNLPVQRSFRDGTRGLARMDAPNGSFVAYSTAPGSVAADGSGGNSPFVTALVEEINKPGQPIEITFRNVRRAVTVATGGKQTPWDSSSLIDSFVFR